MSLIAPTPTTTLSPAVQRTLIGLLDSVAKYQSKQADEIVFGTEEFRTSMGRGEYYQATRIIVNYYLNGTVGNRNAVTVVRAASDSREVAQRLAAIRAYWAAISTPERIDAIHTAYVTQEAAVLAAKQAMLVNTLESLARTVAGASPDDWDEIAIPERIAAIQAAQRVLAWAAAHKGGRTLAQNGKANLDEMIRAYVTKA